MSHSYNSKKERTSVNWDKLFMYLFIRMNFGWAQPFFFSRDWIKFIIDDTIHFQVNNNGDTEAGDWIDLRITKYTMPYSKEHGYKHVYKQIPKGKIVCHCAGDFNADHYALLAERLKNRHTKGGNADSEQCWRETLEKYSEWEKEEKTALEKCFSCNISKADLTLLDDEYAVTNFIDQAVAGSNWVYQVTYDIALAQALVAFTFLLTAYDGDSSC